MDLDPLLKVTLANECSDDLLDKFLKNKWCLFKNENI